MSRPRNLDPPVVMEVSLPLTLRTKLDLLLFSEAEGKVPFGAYRDFFSLKIRETLSSESFDLGPVLGEMPGYYIISGRPEVIRKLKSLLEIPE